MPIDFLSTTNSLQSAVESSWANTVFGGTVSTAIMISILFVLLIMVMYPAKSGTSFWVVVKMWLYALVSVGVLLFLHDGVLRAKIKKEHTDGLNDISVQLSKSTYGSADPAYGGYIEQNSVNATPNVANADLLVQSEQTQPSQQISPPQTSQASTARTQQNVGVLGRGLPAFGGGRKPIIIRNPFK